MPRKPVFLFVLLAAALCWQPAAAQAVRCSEKQRRSDVPEITDPVIVTTCRLRNFRFRNTAYPDYAGRYAHSDHAVFVLVKGHWLRSSNSAVFNARQGELLARINRRIRSEWESLRSDPQNEACFNDDDSLPDYRMNDLAISFHNNEIWFSVDWNDSWACRAIGGAIVSFPLTDIARYLK